MNDMGIGENTSSSLPFSPDRRQSGQSSWGVGQTWKNGISLLMCQRKTINKQSESSRWHYSL